MATTSTKRKSKKKIEVTPSAEVVIAEVKKRAVLGEGRSEGMAFGFLQEVAPNVYQTVQPISPCKDYLAEVVMTEATGIPTKAYGLNYRKQLHIYKDGKAFLGMTLLADHRTKSYNQNDDCDIKKDLELLDKNYKNIEKLLNEFEEKLGFAIKTVITKANDNYYLMELPVEWCLSSLSISLYTLLARVAMYSDGTTDMMTFLQNCTPLTPYDGNTIKSIFPKIELILVNKKLPPNRYQYSRARLKTGMDTPHDRGIVNWDITDSNPFEEVELVD